MEAVSVESKFKLTRIETIVTKQLIITRPFSASVNLKLETKHKQTISSIPINYQEQTSWSYSITRSEINLNSSEEFKRKMFLILVQLGFATQHKTF